jgi:hypothetical protein
LFLDKNGEPIKGAAPLEETAKLLSDITMYQRKGVLGDVTGLQKAAITSINAVLKSSSKVYKTKTMKDKGNIPNLFGMGDVQEPDGEYNIGMKAILDLSDKTYPPTNGATNVAGGSVKALAISDYISNYDKYKKMGMTEKEIRLNVFSSAQKVQRGEIQQSVDNLYRQKQSMTQGGMTYYSKSYIPQLGKELGFPLTVTSTYRPGDPGHHGKKEAVDVSMSEHSLKQKIAFYEKELANPAVKRMGSSDPKILNHFAGNPKLEDERGYDRQNGTNHVNHAHVTLTRGDSMVASAPASKYNFGSVKDAENAKLPKGTIVYIAGRKARIS